LFAQLVKAEVDDDPRHPGPEARFPLELLQPLPAFNPRFLRKINCFFLIPHHTERPRVDLVTMPGDEFLEGPHIAFLRRLYQRLIVSRGMIFITHFLDGLGADHIQARMCHYKASKHQAPGSRETQIPGSKTGLSAWELGACRLELFTAFPSSSATGPQSW